jgi:hypothetical protein
MASVSKIRDLICSYLRGDYKLQEFADRFEDLYSEANIGNKPEVLAYADCVEAFLGRVAAGYSSEADLVSWLEPLSCEPPLATSFSDGYRDQSSSLPYNGELVSSR